MLNEEKLIADFKNKNIGSLKHLYESYRKEFIKWATFKFSILTAEAEDVFSDAVIDVYQNIISERYVKTSTASLKSYLFEIGKNKILNILNRQKISENHLKNISYLSGSTVDPVTTEKTELISKVHELMDMIDEKCRKVLTLFYFHNMAMGEIANEMEFKNEDVAKNKKLKCLKRLQDLAYERISKNDYYD